MGVSQASPEERKRSAAASGFDASPLRMSSSVLLEGPLSARGTDSIALTSSMLRKSTSMTSVSAAGAGIGQTPSHPMAGVADSEGGRCDADLGREKAL